jgi:hypothetical protein
VLKEGGALIDIEDGVHVLGVGEADVAVAGRGGGDLVRRLGLAEPGVRVARRDLRERGEELAERVAMGVEGAAVVGAQGVFEERVDGCRKRGPVLRLGVVHTRARVTDVGGRRAARRPAQVDALRASAASGVDALGAGDEDELEVAVVDALGGLVHLPLRRVAAERGVDLLARGDREGVREIVRGRFRRPGEDVDDAHGVEAVEQIAGLGIGLGETGGFRHQRQRFARTLGAGSLGDLAGADDDGEVFVQRFSPQRHRGAEG